MIPEVVKKLVEAYTHFFQQVGFILLSLSTGGAVWPGVAKWHVLSRA